MLLGMARCCPEAVSRAAGCGRSWTDPDDYNSTYTSQVGPSLQGFYHSPAACQHGVLVMWLGLHKGIPNNKDFTDRLTWHASLKSHKAPAHQAVHIHTPLLITAVHLIQLCLIGSIYADIFWAVEALQSDLAGYLTLAAQQE